MKQILLLGAGKSATVLIEYLAGVCDEKQWRFTVADANLEQVQHKTRHLPATEALQLNIQDDEARSNAIQHADLVISMMPPALHYLVAKDCLNLGKHLLTASYLDDSLRQMAESIKNKGLLFLCEMGLDPGIDHMSAMRLIHQLQRDGKEITSFKSHCGGLVAPESDNNPWHYKISWNPRNVVLAGMAGAVYLKNGAQIQKSYSELFDACEEVQVPGLPSLACYPNRDSLSYIPVYGLDKAQTFLRTTLRYPVYCRGWKNLITAGLTNDREPLPNSIKTVADWAEPVFSLQDDETAELYEYLGMRNSNPLPEQAKTNADVLQFLLETRLNMQPADRDMIVMLHEFVYSGGTVSSSLVVKGTDSLRTAMAKTVGLPLGIAARLILEDQITVRGLYIPILPEIYNPVLNLLEEQGIRFEETFG